MMDNLIILLMNYLNSNLDEVIEELVINPFAKIRSEKVYKIEFLDASLPLPPFTTRHSLSICSIDKP